MSITDQGRRLIEIVELDLDRCSLTYGVAPCTASGSAGEECYNTFRTCQDTDNYARTTYTYRFTRRGTPAPVGTTVRPYIIDINEAATEIDPDKGLGYRASLRVRLVDTPDSDTEQDPYFATRATEAASTWWRRLIARNLATAGRAARRKRLYITPGENYTLSDPDWTTEAYIIEAINGPSARGDVELIVKDPLKSLDRVQLPAPSEGELLSALGASDLSLTLKSGQGAGYAATGEVCVSGKEVIQYTGKSGDVLSWPNTTYRGQGGTSAQAHSVNARVQQVQAWSAATVTTVLEELYNAGGITDGEIDLAGLAGIASVWFGTYALSVRLVAPEKISDLVKELLVTLQMAAWWDAASQKVKHVALRPLSPLAAAPVMWTDAANLMDAATDIARQEDKRITSVLVWYAPRDCTEKKDEVSNYQRGALVVDADAVSANEYGESRQLTLFTRFLDVSGDQAAAELAIRLLGFRRDAPIEVKTRIDPKDSEDAALGEQLDLEHQGLVDFDGNVERARVLVTKRKDNGTDLEVSLLVTFLNRRYFWIAPDGHPDYGAATEEEQRYGYISDASGKLSDGSEGHVIV